MLNTHHKENMIKIDKEDADSMTLLLEKQRCARQCLNTACDGFTKAEMETFYKATIDALGAYQWLYNDLWQSFFDKYGLDRSKSYTLKDDYIYEQ